jgi:hypothetical protein
MKKSLAFILSLSMFVIITACDGTQKTKLDDTSLMLLSGSGIKITYPEMYSLAGTTWTKRTFSSSLTQTDTLVTSTTTLEIPLKQTTMILAFNSNGTFTATYAERYLPAWDSRLVNSGTRTFSVQHQSSTNAAFVGYSGQFCNGNTDIVWTGTWRRIKVESLMGHEDDYTWDYQTKILNKHSITYSITETATTYNITNTTFTDDTVIDEDADWVDTLAELNLGDGGNNVGTELNFVLALGGPFTGGTYTRN